MPDSLNRTADINTANAPAAAIEINDLRKTYRGTAKAPPKEALKGISLTIPRGSIYGLLGPNGAGKSTTINILAGLVNKTSGKAKIWGIDIDEQPRSARAAIGVVPQELNLDPFFTPREILDLQAGLYGVPKAERQTDALLEAVGLKDKANAYARTLSGGMRRRLMVAKAMVHAPPVLVLDEPTAGVDVELRQSLWSHVRDLNKAGTTIVLTTHYLEEAQELCDTIAIVNHGQVVACESTENLLSRIDSKEMVVTLDADLLAVPDAFRGFDARLDGLRRLTIHYKPSQTRVADLLGAMALAGLAVKDLSMVESDLEDVFLQMTRAPAA
ncbi:multidrug ABC transporter ATP-binding protein [Niveispirillum lacus]|uniref:Multidrug ABC transporter ATP-binding protein n=1 Tax=Niveispirillum lacus TaxID=1981099 RepID=A0A255Z3G2_9PROT|nr:ABC transporter ATP-binding protein [Niveispirillum lacus]OYQ36018.1 multidrug ABC transporter ATP-binding protein [Niveispirillum lacus]